MNIFSSFDLSTSSHSFRLALKLTAPVRYLFFFASAWPVAPSVLSNMLRSFYLLSSISLALGGTILWDGRFNDMSSSTDLDNWSWSDQTGPYQYYIVRAFLGI